MSEMTREMTMRGAVTMSEMTGVNLTVGVTMPKITTTEEITTTGEIRTDEITTNVETEMRGGTMPGGMIGMPEMRGEMAAGAAVTGSISTRMTAAGTTRVATAETAGIIIGKNPGMTTGM